VVFGVEFNSELKVVHSYTNSIEKAFVYRKSKYVQSEIGQSYRHAKGFLQDGKKVLFTGTPCQISGLKAYLGEEYENLLCVDLVCRGVPNQFLFNMYLNELTHENGSKIGALEFRYRVKRGTEYDARNICFTLSSGRKVIKSRKKSSYLRGFYSTLYFRPSCYSCPYANPNRVSDITIADFWKVKELYPDLDPHQGVSLIYVNSNRGREIISTLNQQMDIRPVELEFAIRYGGQFREPTKYNKYREKFFKLIKEGVSLKSAVKHCTPKVSILKVIVSKLLGQKRKEKLKQFLGR
jgi:coenzyme F420-reducing hydrogenase beta subunit